MTTTQKLQKKLNDSKAMRWTALIIVSFTMMMAYFFTDVMGPLEAPLTTKGKLVYFDNGTYLSADSLSKVCIEEVGSIDEITAGKTYNIVYNEDNKLKKEITKVNNVYTLADTTIATTGKYIALENGTILDATSIKAFGLKSEIKQDEIAEGKNYQVLHIEKKNNVEKILNDNLKVESIIKGLGWTSSNYGFFSGAYGLINVFLLMLFFGGIILDKMGVRFTGVMSTGLMFLGATIKWYAVNNVFTGEVFGLPTQVAIASLGFAVYGVGCEIAGITVTKVIAKWFTGHEMALAMGLQVALARLGTASAMAFALPLAKQMGLVSAPVMIGAGALCIGFLSYMVYCVMDKKFDKSAGIEKISADPDEQFKFSDLKVIFCNKGFWLITFLCLIFYSAVFPFMKFAPKLMEMKYNVNSDFAGSIVSMLPFGTILLTPLFGSLYDRIGKGATLMLIGSVLLTIVHILFALPILSFGWFAIIVMILLGIAFSLVPSAMWPSVPKIIPMKQLGSAYAIIFYIQNIGLSLVPMLIGSVIDNNTAADGTVNYSIPMSIFALFGVLAVLISLILKRTDKKYNYGLEQPTNK